MVAACVYQSQVANGVLVPFVLYLLIHHHHLEEMVNHPEFRMSCSLRGLWHLSLCPSKHLPMVSRWQLPRSPTAATAQQTGDARRGRVPTFHGTGCPASYVDCGSCNSAKGINLWGSEWCNHLARKVVEKKWECFKFQLLFSWFENS